MPISFDTLWTKAREIAEKDLGHVIDHEYVIAISMATITALGFHVNERGEVCDPRPAPPTFPQPGAPYSRYSRRRK